MSVHPGHGIFVWLVGGFAREDIHLRVVGNHALVHAIESQALTVGTPEGALVNAKLITVDALAINYLATTVSRQLVFLALGVNDV